MSFRTIPRAFVDTAVGAIFLIAQFIPGGNAQGSPTGPSKPVISQMMYVFSWPNGYSQVGLEGSLSCIVTNIDFSIVGPELRIDSDAAIYDFSVSKFAITLGDLPRLKLAHVADSAGFDVEWPKALPSLSGPSAYVVVTDPRMPFSADSLRMFDILHQYYQAHRLELAAAAQARAAATPSPSPTPGPPVSFKRIEYPSPSPGHH
jgi:hypothetical protein